MTKRGDRPGDLRQEMSRISQREEKLLDFGERKTEQKMLPQETWGNFIAGCDGIIASLSHPSLFHY